MFQCLFPHDISLEVEGTQLGPMEPPHPAPLSSPMALPPLPSSSMAFPPPPSNGSPSTFSFQGFLQPLHWLLTSQFVILSLSFSLSLSLSLSLLLSFLFSLFSFLTKLIFQGFPVVLFIDDSMASAVTGKSNYTFLFFLFFPVRVRASPLEAV